MPTTILYIDEEIGSKIPVPIGYGENYEDAIEHARNVVFHEGGLYINGVSYFPVNSGCSESTYRDDGITRIGYITKYRYWRIELTYGLDSDGTALIDMEFRVNPGPNKYGEPQPSYTTESMKLVLRGETEIKLDLLKIPFKGVYDPQGILGKKKSIFDTDKPNYILIDSQKTYGVGSSKLDVLVVIDKSKFGFSEFDLSNNEQIEILIKATSEEYVINNLSSDGSIQEIYTIDVPRGNAKFSVKMIFNIDFKKVSRQKGLLVKKMVEEVVPIPIECEIKIRSGSFKQVRNAGSNGTLFFHF